MTWRPVLQARTTPRVFKLVRAQAWADGITISEWLRRLVWAELRRGEAPKEAEMTLLEDLERHIDLKVDENGATAAGETLYEAWSMFLVELRALSVGQIGPLEPAMEAALKALQGGPKV